MKISGTTRLYAILGDPIAKVRTPEHFNALFAARGIDAVMLPVEVAQQHLPDAFRSLKHVRNLGGLILTMPHKAAMSALVDELEPMGKRVGAVNAVRREADGRWRGDMFDGRGYTGALARLGIDPRGKRVQLIGAGGVARAIGVALQDAGVSAFTITDLDATRARGLASLLEGTVCSEPHSADIVVNCTPLGMREGDPLPCDVAALKKGAVVSDVTTKPEITPFLAAARERGHPVTTGRDMFEAQAEALARFFGWA